MTDLPDHTEITNSDGIRNLHNGEENHRFLLQLRNSDPNFSVEVEIARKKIIKDFLGLLILRFLFLSRELGPPLIFHKKDPKDCPDNDGHNVDAIDGLVLPSITALAATARQLSLASSDSLELTKEARISIQQASIKTAAVTRSSNVLATASAAWADLVSDALILPISDSDAGNSMLQPIYNVAMQLKFSKPQPNRSDQMSACYLSQSLPPTLDMLAKYTRPSFLNNGLDGIWKALLANANIGGENVHRAACLGVILGARVGDEYLPHELKSGLYERQALEKEIDSFVVAVMKNTTSQKQCVE